ncbi:hypothetical protein CMI48_02335 [Candidatus Pacearchaeota archaeon]|nr:hypothetical protein [Candidatus Pacearchaeota archaeon]|tara:strand:- start:961 stop:1476 length:516 start_codon:yes stop_codon:yes gene_type:complete
MPVLVDELPIIEEVPLPHIPLGRDSEMWLFGGDVYGWLQKYAKKNRPGGKYVSNWFGKDLEEGIELGRKLCGIRDIGVCRKTHDWATPWRHAYVLFEEREMGCGLTVRTPGIYEMKAYNLTPEHAKEWGDREVVRLSLGTVVIDPECEVMDEGVMAENLKRIGTYLNSGFI